MVSLVRPHRCFIYPTLATHNDQVYIWQHKVSTKHPFKAVKTWALRSDIQYQCSVFISWCWFIGLHNSIVCVITNKIHYGYPWMQQIYWPVAYLKSYGKPFVSKLSIQKIRHVRLQNQLNCEKLTRFVPRSTRLSAQLTRSLDCKTIDSIVCHVPLNIYWFYLVCVNPSTIKSILQQSSWFAHANHSHLALNHTHLTCAVIQSASRPVFKLISPYIWFTPHLRH